MIAVKSSIKCRDIFRKALKATWYEFVQRTTIHGLRYIIDKQGNKFTRTLWLIVTLVGFIASNVLVDTFWLRYKENPTRLNVDSFHRPLNKLDLPAITICQVKHVDEERARKFVDELTIPPNVAKSDLLKYLAQGSAFTNKIVYNVDELNVLQKILNENKISVVETMQAIHQPCSDLLVRCRFEYQIRPCMELFEPSMSYLGMCCTFNGNNNFPHTQYYGRGGGLSVMMKPTSSVDYSTTYSRDVKLLIHKSIAFPSDLSVVKMLSHRSENIIRICSDVTKCSSDVKALPIDERDCILPSEKRLRFFQKYAENNCDIECRMAQIVRLCGCFPYNYPITSIARYPVCNFTRIDCLVSNYFEIHESRMHLQETCKCPPDCNSVSFDASMAKVPIIVSNFTEDYFYEGVNSNHMIAHISFGKQVYKELRRDLLINVIILACNYTFQCTGCARPNNIISNYLSIYSFLSAGLGGIYSLFIGMGVLTFFEIFYFATFRLRAHYVQIRKERMILRVNTRRIVVRGFRRPYSGKKFATRKIF